MATLCPRSSSRVRSHLVKVELDPPSRSRRPRAAQDYPFVPLGFAQYVVAMLHLARQILRRTDAAQAVGALYVDGNSGLLERFRRLLVWRQPGRSAPVEAISISNSKFSHSPSFGAEKYSRWSEFFGPTERRGCFEHGVHEGRRPAGVDVIAFGISGEHRRHIESVLVAEVEVDPIAPRHLLEFGNERGLSARPGLVVEFEGTIRARKLVRHGDQRRDADAAGQQQMPTVTIRDWKVIARLRYDHRSAGLEHLMDLERPATTLIFPQDTQQIFETVRGIARERELTNVLRASPSHRYVLRR